MKKRLKIDWHHSKTPTRPDVIRYREMGDSDKKLADVAGPAYKHFVFVEIQRRQLIEAG